MSATSGRTPLESFGTWDPAGRCWRTCQASLLTGTLEPLSGSFPKSGMTVSGALYRRQMPERPTGERDGGFWPTPRANELDYSEHVQGLHGMNYIAKDGREWGINLTTAVKTWPTPSAMDTINRKGMRPSREATGRTTGYLSEMVMFPTPRANKWGLPDSHGNVSAWATPAARGWKGEGYEGQLGTQIGGSLNPTWVEWLMGLPLGWTALEPLGMELSLLSWLNSFGVTDDEKRRIWKICNNGGDLAGLT
jgi:hypothetical protein